MATDTEIGCIHGGPATGRAGGSTFEVTRSSSPPGQRLPHPSLGWQVVIDEQLPRLRQHHALAKLLLQISARDEELGRGVIRGVHVSRYDLTGNVVLITGARAD